MARSSVEVEVDGSGCGLAEMCKIYLVALRFPRTVVDDNESDILMSPVIGTPTYSRGSGVEPSLIYL